MSPITSRQGDEHEEPGVSAHVHFEQPPACSAFLLALLCGLTMAATQPALAQMFQVIHNFTGGFDGEYPRSGFSIDAAGNLYGTTFAGGAGFGTVFKLKHAGSGWIVTPLYSFRGGSDGAGPLGRVIVASDGTLYGTTSSGGGNGCSSFGCGTASRLRPPASRPASALSPWTESVLYRFTGGNDGAYPQGELTFDHAGNIYGTTQYGGDTNSGVVYQLTPSGGGWTESVPYSAQNNGDGANPLGGVVLDAAGSLYGVFNQGGLYGSGAVYQLSFSGSGWTEQNLHDFMPQGGEYPVGGLIMDASGNLYGSTTVSMNNNGGFAVELTPAGGGWTYTLLPNLGIVGPDDRLFFSMGPAICSEQPTRAVSPVQGLGFQVDTIGWRLDVHHTP